MYIKVHTEGNQWFRDDNGDLVGENVFSLSKDFLFFKYMNNIHSLAKNNNRLYPIYEGYFDEKFNFIHFCNSKTECNFCSRSKRIMFCKKEHTFQKNKTGGYYVNLPN